MIVGVNTKVPLDNGTYTTAINFDNAATTPPFYSVEKEVRDFLPWYSSIHRGRGYKSMLSTEVYEAGRDIVKSFVKADNKKDILIYTKNTTDSINMLAFILSQEKDGRDVVLSTWMEHAANDLPWRDKFTVDYIEVDQFGRLSLEDYEEKLKKYKNRVKLVTVAGASNVTGYINDIHLMAAMAHRNGAKIHVDGAQLVPHVAVDMKDFESDEHIDYLSFSAHKMYAPYGCGVLIGPKTTFEDCIPCCVGGSIIKLITHERIWWEEPPQKNEAGSPNLIGIVAMVSAIKTLSKIGMSNAYNVEKNLHDYAFSKMKSIPDIKFYSSPDKQETIGVIPFNIEGVHHSLMSAILSYEAGIAVRNGYFCSHPYCENLLGLSAKDMEDLMNDSASLFPGIVRVSFGIYNDHAEIDKLVCFLKQIASNKKYYIDKYSNSRGRYNIKNEV
ncbi:aminotransferase class V-fold PLP-dependent enzyme [Ruminiclostridium herbifermentans]|nr:aminotransferase class V-fold PLP-dependent enzyme [Ruminiclostridium herbifermentans]